jgi:hypothetical protein
MFEPLPARILPRRQRNPVRTGLARLAAQPEFSIIASIFWLYLFMIEATGKLR